MKKKEADQRRPFFGLLLVLIQLACLVALVMTGPVRPLNLAAGLLIFLALGVGLWALVVMGPTRVKVRPEPAGRSRLMTTGPYALVRHPMYLAVLLFAAGLVCNLCSWVRLLIWLVLAADLVFKARYEERLLRARFPSYDMYCRDTKRIVPWIF